jgi:hypothetical protein
VQVKVASLLLLKGQSGTSNYAEVLGLCEKAATRHYALGAVCMGELYLGGF